MVVDWLVAILGLLEIILSWQDALQTIPIPVYVLLSISVVL